MKSVLLLSLVLMTGCSLQPVIQASNKASWHSGHIDKITIIYLSKKLGTEVAYIKQEEFLKLDDAFIEYGISSDLYDYTGLDLNAEKKLDYYMKKNNYYLIIDPTHRMSGNTQSITYQISLFMADTQKKIWVSNLYVPSGWIEPIYQRFDEMSKSIVDRLVIDGLVARKIIIPYKS